jgi:hypothetical protein
MPWRGPQFEGELPSLGWELIELWADLFPSPRDESAPFVLIDDQALTVVEWYTIDPLTGRFVYRRGCSRRAKGVGKSPIEAAKCISELALPVRFDGWNADGEPVARPWGLKGDPQPWIQIASLSEDQDENTYSPLYYFLTANDGAAADRLGIDAGLTRCLLRGRPAAKIEPVTSRAGSREGQPITYGCLDESGYMTVENGGVKLAKTIRRNATKMDGRTYETTNGFEPGINSVAEATHKAVEKGAPGIMYDAVEAPSHVDGVEVTPDAPDEILRRALTVAYGKAWWVDVDRVVLDIRDPDMPWEDAERFFFNWNRKGGGRAVDPKEWANLATPDRLVVDGERIALGFDGSISEDSTALVGCTEAGHLFLIKSWDRPLGSTGWRVPRLDVHATIADCFERFRVGRMYCDPPKWDSEIEQWAALWNPLTGDEDIVIIFDTNQARKMAPACDRFSTAITEKALSHSDADVLTRHTLALTKKKVRIKDDEDDGRTRYIFTKPMDGRKIDAGVAAILAFEAAATMPAEQVAELWFA